MSTLYGVDFPAAVANFDDTLLLNLSNTSYTAGTPEVGVYFVAPRSLRVMITIHGGARDNTNNNRVFMSTELYRRAATGEQIMTADVAANGWGTPGSNNDMLYGSRTFLVDDDLVKTTEPLIAGQIYYARVVYAVETTTGSTADIANRGIIVEPVP